MSDRQELAELRRLEELEARAAPKPLKLGAEGMGDSMRQVMKESGPMASRVAAFGSFPRQMYEGVKQMFGAGDEGNIRAVRALEEEHPVASISGGIASMVPLSRIPGLNTIAGQAALGAGAGASMPVLNDESRLLNSSIGGAVGGGVTAALKGAALGTGKLLSGSQKQAASQASKQSVRDATIKESQAAGYVLPPTVTGGGAMSVTLESLGGKAAIGQEASIRNQQVTNTLARKAAGLAPDEEITEATLAAARKTIAQPYREVAAVSPRAAQALEKLKEANLDVKDLWRQYGQTPSPAVRRELAAAENKIDVLERLIEKEAGKAGKSGLVDALKEARVALAKNHDVERALNIGDGTVDAKIIGGMLDKRGVKGVTGELQTIGKFANAFGHFARHAPVGQSAPDVSRLTPYAAAALGLGGFATSDRLGMGPWGVAAAGLPLLSGGSRSIALSKLMQTPPSYSPSTSLRLADTAVRDALPKAAIPSAMTLQEIVNQ